MIPAKTNFSLAQTGDRQPNLPLATKLAVVGEQIAAFARIGDAGPVPPGSPIPVQGLDCLTAAQHSPVLEARLGAEGRLVIQPATTGQYPEPSGYKTVVVGFGRDQVTYTAARHWIEGTNSHGQNGADFPFCLVNLPAWRRTPWDLRAAEWYHSEAEALAKYEPEPPAPNWSACVASFACGVQIELRRESGGRWLMSEVRGLRRARRKDFTSPSLDHAKRTAAIWYGEPIGDWKEIKDEKAAKRQQIRRK